MAVTPPADGTIAMSIESRGSSIAELPAAAPGASLTHDAVLQPGDYEVWLRPGTISDSTYSLEVRRLDPFTSPDAIAKQLPLELTLTPDATEVAAYVSTGQRIDGQLQISDTGPSDLDLTLDARDQPLRLVGDAGAVDREGARRRDRDRAGLDRRPTRCLGRGPGPGHRARPG